MDVRKIAKEEFDKLGEFHKNNALAWSWWKRAYDSANSRFSEIVTVDETDVYGLDDVLARFILPRLQKLYDYRREMGIGENEDDTNLVEMIEAFKIVIKHDNMYFNDPIYIKGIETFSKKFASLWI